MKKKLLKLNFFVAAFLCIILLIGCTNRNEQSLGSYPIQPVPFTSVKITDSFWAPKMKINHDVTIPIALEQSKITG